VLVAAALEQLDVWVVALVGLVDQPGDGLHLEVRQVAALEKADQVSGREDKLAVWSSAPMQLVRRPAQRVWRASSRP